MWMWMWFLMSACFFCSALRVSASSFVPLCCAVCGCVGVGDSKRARHGNPTFSSLSFPFQWRKSGKWESGCTFSHTIHTHMDMHRHICIHATWQMHLTPHSHAWTNADGAEIVFSESSLVQIQIQIQSSETSFHLVTYHFITRTELALVNVFGLYWARARSGRIKDNWHSESRSGATNYRYLLWFMFENGKEEVKGRRDFFHFSIPHLELGAR